MSLDAGDVTVALGEHSYVLRRTPDAGFKISQHFNGFTGAFDAVKRLDFMAIAAIVRIGSDGKPADDKTIAQQILSSVGMAGAAAPLLEYLMGFLGGPSEGEAEGN